MFDQVWGIVTAQFHSTSRDFVVAKLAFSQCTRRRIMKCFHTADIFFSWIVFVSHRMKMLPRHWIRAAIGTFSLVWSRPIVIASESRESRGCVQVTYKHQNGTGALCVGTRRYRYYHFSAVSEPWYSTGIGIGTIPVLETGISIGRHITSLNLTTLHYRVFVGFNKSNLKLFRTF